MKYIEIIFCAAWGFQTQAASVAEEIKKQYPQVEVESVPSSGGVFDIVVDGEIIFSKEKKGFFPKKGEIVSLIAKKYGKWMRSQA